MIPINKAEKEAILEKYPNTHIARTMRADSKRHHYFCEESRKVMMLLDKIRSGGEVYGTTAKKRR